MIYYLRIEEVIDFHDMLIEKYGGLSGIRDLGFLASAMAMPQQSFKGEELHRTIYEKAAAYMYHVIKNHPFFDGNKRTGVIVSLVFLQRNGENLDFNGFILEELAVAVAENKVSKTELTILLQNRE
jgi:death-on-curing protein